MVKIIETNLSINPETNEVMDHKSRIIEVNSWEKYVDYYFNYMNGFKDMKEFKCLSGLVGCTLLPNVEIKNLEYDDIHLDCDSIKKINCHGEQYTIITKKLAYLIEEE